MEGRVSHLVVDAAAFLNNVQFHEFADKVYTLNEVVDEIIDQKTKERLQVLPYELIFRLPSPESIKAVIEFSKKTGDFPSLSATDIKVLALTYQLHKEYASSETLNTEPKKVITAGYDKTNDGPVRLPGFYLPTSAWEDVEETDISEDITGEDTDCEDKQVAENEEEELEDEDENWVTPDNLQDVMKDFGLLTVRDPVVVGCITSDFAMQNVLLQMGLKVLAVNGIIIKHAKTFILRCYSCFKTTSNMMSKFCPRCGNPTLKKVQIDVGEDGQVSLRINFRRKLTSRGKRFSLPMPKGGKHSTDPILCADQPIPQNRLAKKALQKTDALSPDYVADVSPFAIKDVYSRSAQLNVHKCGRMIKGNPNSVRGPRKSRY